MPFLKGEISTTSQLSSPRAAIFVTPILRDVLVLEPKPMFFNRLPQYWQYCSISAFHYCALGESTLIYSQLHAFSVQVEGIHVAPVPCISSMEMHSAGLFRFPDQLLQHNSQLTALNIKIANFLSCIVSYQYALWEKSAHFWGKLLKGRVEN